MDITWEGFQKELDKLTGCGKLGEYMARDIFNYLGSIESKPVGRDEVEDGDIIYTIDTCWCNDTNIWETGVRVQLKNGKTVLPWVIIEYYLNETEASLAHEQWVEYIMDESPTFFVSVQDKKIYGFIKEDI